MFDLFKSLAENSAFNQLDADEFLEKFEATTGSVLLDVRRADEVAGGILKGALHIDFNSPSFTRKLSDLDKKKAYFVYCQNGQRSGNTCRAMHNIGFTKLYNMAGGINALNPTTFSRWLSQR